jgi:hypothetical protein
MKKLLTITILSIISFSTYAQLEIDGEIRPRFEYRDGYKTLKLNDTNPAKFATQRTRLGLSYKTDLYTTRISFQDVRVWGSEALKSNSISAKLCEAWVEFNMTDYFRIKAGRQILSYDNERLIGSANWNQYGSQHDAIKFSYKKNKFELEVVGAYNQSSETLNEVPYTLFNKLYQELGIIWAKQSFKNLSVASITIIERNRIDDISNKSHGRYTTGLIFNFNKNKINANFRTFYQGGKKNTGQKVSAYYFNLELAYKVTKRYSLRVDFDLLSGNNPGLSTKKDNAFNLLYGGRHKFNGSIDYFTSAIPNSGFGLIDWSLGMSYKVCRRLTTKLNYHYYRTHKEFKYTRLYHSPYLGSEFDLQANFKFTKEISMVILYAMMLPSETMAAVQNIHQEVRTGNYCTLMITFKPKFLK